MGFDTVQNLSINKFQCLKDNDHMFFMVEYGRVWESLTGTAYRTSRMLLKVEEATHRLNDEGVKYGMVFLDIQMFDWPSDKEENRNTIDAMGQKLDDLSINKFRCLKDNGYMFFIGRIWKSLGEFDWDGLQNIKNAFEAGLYVSVHIFPCLNFSKCAPVQDQVEETINRLNDEGAKYGMVFLDIQKYKWPSDKEENRNTIDAMGQKLDEMGVEWGIYTDKRYWDDIVGDWDKWKHKKLWWCYFGPKNGERYSNFTPFGGWTDFYMQQYAGDYNEPCYVPLALDYYRAVGE